MSHTQKSCFNWFTIAILAVSVSAQAEIVFVDLDDLPIEEDTPARLFDGPFGATIHHDPATAEGSLIATDSGYVPSGTESAARMTADSAINRSISFSSPVVIGGFQTVGGTL